MLQELQKTEVIPEKWKDFYNEWNIRGFVVLSLLLQTFLILFAPMRKRSRSNMLMMALWSAYLLADWVANISIGLISNSQGDSSKDKSGSSINDDLLAFWAPFLLVHLGGPDTITALALEDNELWLRHLLALLLQSVTTVYVFIQSLPNKRWIPTSIMFLTGIIKYGERIRSLYLGSLDSYRDSVHTNPNPWRNTQKLRDIVLGMDQIHVPNRTPTVVNETKEENLGKKEIVLYAYNFFKTFKALFVDVEYNIQERNQSREFFLRITPKDAFGVVAVELNLLYSTLFTKLKVVCSRLGYLGRFLSFSAVVAILVLFINESKHDIKPIDVVITYMLIGGAITLDIIATLMLVSSDWFKAQTQMLPEFLDGDQTQTPTSQNSCARNLFFTLFRGLQRLFTRRWSESVSSLNLINYCSKPRPVVNEKLIDFIGLTNFLDSLRYVEEKPFTDALRDHIFTELKEKAYMATDRDNAKKISAARGEFVLQVENQKYLAEYILGFEYYHSLIVWHIATEFCLVDKTILRGSEENTRIESITANKTQNEYRSFAKLLSDYMMYLLVMQPTMMSSVAGFGQKRFHDNCEELRKVIYKERKFEEPTYCQVINYIFISLFKYAVFSVAGILVILLFPVLSLIIPILYLTWPNILNKAGNYCSKVRKSLYATPSELEREHIITIKNIVSALIEEFRKVARDTMSDEASFPDATRDWYTGLCLANYFSEEFPEEERWKLISKVWVEMLSYAACNCRANAHAQQLSKGGELITMVWLLMAQFGIDQSTILQLEKIDPSDGYSS